MSSPRSVPPFAEKSWDGPQKKSPHRHRSPPPCPRVPDLGPQLGLCPKCWPEPSRWYRSRSPTPAGPACKSRLQRVPAPSTAWRWRSSCGSTPVVGGVPSPIRRQRGRHLRKLSLANGRGVLWRPLPHRQSEARLEGTPEKAKNQDGSSTETTNLPQSGLTIQGPWSLSPPGLSRIAPGGLLHPGS